MATTRVDLANRRVLLVDDEESIRFGVSRVLQQHGARVKVAGSVAEGLAAVREEVPEIVLLDLKLPDGDGIDLLGRILSERPEVRVVMMTGYGTIERAVTAIQCGADDFLTKPINVEHLLHVLKRLSDSSRLASQNLLYKRELERAVTDLVWGESERMGLLLDEARRAAGSDALIVLTGESGTGKGVLAHQIHEWSPRKSEPFVNVNCAGLNRELLESELFGHEKGSFTGASAAKPGLFELADRGTLFLDEVAEIDLSLQPRLLKAVEEQRFHRVGGTAERRVNVRVIAATNRNLKEEVTAGRFRSDLYYRLNVLEMRLPSLRERKGDVSALARKLLEGFSLRAGRGEHRLDARGERLLEAYPWPGNIRELRNIMERISILAGPGIVPVELIGRFLGTTPEPVRLVRPTLDEREKEYIDEVLRATAGNKSAAAEILGITRNTLYAKIKLYGLGVLEGPEANVP
ncbi:MAG: sigma-54 dependent transcriptional regulator [Thermoanaerobaculia bacterium]